MKGIDVSDARGVIDWSKAKAAGVEFAMLRCGYGSDEPGQDDKQFEANVAGCEANGIPYGVYLYSYALNLDDSESEFQHLLRCLKGKRPLYPVCIDMEDADGYKARHGMPTNDMLVNICDHVCSRLEGAGYYAAIYANKDWLTNRLNSPVLDRYDKWLAQWADKPTYTGHYGIWQYTSDGAVDGINGRVDMDETIGDIDYPGYIRSNNLNGWVAEPVAAPIAPAAPATVSVTYRVKTVKHGWLSPVTDLSDYAGYQESPIIGVTIGVSAGTVRYRVHVKGGNWLAYVTGYDIGDYINGFAGNDKVIDAIEVYYMIPDSIKQYKMAKYRVAPCGGNYYDWQHDNITDGGQDGYAGAFGHPIGKLQIVIE